VDGDRQPTPAMKNCRHLRCPPSDAFADRVDGDITDKLSE
jgi:hypothetical protein